MSACTCLGLERFKAVLSDVEGKEAQCLAYETEGSAGFDFKACIEEPVVIEPGKIKIIPTGKRVEFFYNDELVVNSINGILPEIQVRSKSGLSTKGIVVLNAPGTVDADFKGEIGVIIMNLSSTPYTIEKGVKIGQGCLAFVSNRVMGVEVKKIERGEGGFGHTGK